MMKISGKPNKINHMPIGVGEVGVGGGGQGWGSAPPHPPLFYILWSVTVATGFENGKKNCLLPFERVRRNSA